MAEKTPLDELVEIRDEGLPPSESLKSRRNVLPEFSNIDGGRLERETEIRFLQRVLDAMVDAACGVNVAYRFTCPDREAEVICDRLMNHTVVSLALSEVFGFCCRKVERGVATMHVDFFPASAYPPEEMVDSEAALNRVEEDGWELPKEEDSTSH